MKIAFLTDDRNEFLNTLWSRRKEQIERKEQMKVIDFKDAKCRHCYKCVRNCMVKAIAVQDEQARILKDHCINCGRCLEVW